MTRALTAAALIAMASAAGAAPASTSGVEATVIDNAALLYLRTVEIYDRSGINDLYDQMVSDDAAVAPGSEGAKKLTRSQDAVNLLLRAAAMTECDFEIDYSEGFDTLLPHLGQLRAMSKLLAADARRLELAGDLPGSVARTVALYRMSDHITRNGVLINSLVGVAIANVGHEQSERLAELELKDADRQALLAALDALDGDDPYRVLEAIRIEQGIVRDWITREFSGDEGPSEFARAMSSMVADPLDDESQAAFDEMDAEAFESQVNEAADAYSLVIDALRSGDMDKLDELEKQVQAGEHGMVAKIIVPAFRNAAGSRERAIGDLARVRELLKGDD
jgi:hypothetical protein